MRTLETKADLLKVRDLIYQLLPDSIQMLNVILLTAANDGIERTIFVNDNHTSENVALIAIDKVEFPRLTVSLFSTKRGESVLQDMLRIVLNWDQEMLFAVKINYHIQYQYLSSHAEKCL